MIKKNIIIIYLYMNDTILSIRRHPVTVLYENDFNAIDLSR